MKLLPPILSPWRVTIERRHTPAERRSRTGYRAYRSCLRWEFGFTCPFCLCHEADFAPRGAEGLGITQIEHFTPVNHDVTGIHLYANCFYICQFCNRARSATPNIDPADGNRLLNPCEDAWAEYFYSAGDEIQPREGSSDAAYTHATYHLNDPRKIARRRYRRITIEECLDLLERGGVILTRLLKEAAIQHDPSLVEESRVLQDALRRAWRDLEMFEVVPQDASDSCACNGEDYRSIPSVLEEQTVEFDSP